MAEKKTFNVCARARCVTLVILVCFGCGGDDNGPDDEQTGTSLQGTVTSFRPRSWVAGSHWRPRRA